MPRTGTILELSVFLAMLLTCRIGTAEELSIAAEPYYREVPWPKPHSQVGPLCKPLPPDWKSISLNGTWKFKEVLFRKDNANPLQGAGMDQEFFKQTHEIAAWQDISVPSSWYYKADGKKKKGMIGWYCRDFSLTPEQLADNRHVVLDFRRVAWQADVWVNGKKAGKRHVGRFDSFQYDITPLVHAGVNRIAVRVYDYVGHTSYQRRHIGGIYHPVRLLLLPTAVQCHRILVTSDIAAGSIDVLADIVNPGQDAVKLSLCMTVRSTAGNAVIANQQYTSRQLAPGINQIRLGSLKLTGAKPWTPESPSLYTLTLSDQQGRSIGCERFGFRDFRVRNEWLLLNGRRFKPRAFTLDLWRNLDLRHNRGSMLEKMLRHYKRIGINMIRPHSKNGVPCETFFTLCDEIGLLVYLDWSGPAYHAAFGKKWKNSILEMWPSFKAFIRDYYSHPCICMWSLGNEIYEGHYNLSFSKNLDKLYGLVKRLDRQDRPICSSTGRQLIGALNAGLLHERTDVLDDHQYLGAYCGSWQENIAHIKTYAKVALKYYGTLKPKIDCEYGVPGDNLRYRNLTFKRLYPAFKLDPAGEEFKKRYISFVTSPKAEIGDYIRLKLTYCSPRTYVMDEAECRRLYAEKFFKRVVEIYRRAGNMCIGGHTNAQWYDVVLPTLNWGNTAARWGKPGPIDRTRDTWIEMPVSFVTKRVYNPTLVSMPPFNQHPLPGSRQKVSVVVTNDLPVGGNFRVVMQLRLNGLKLLDLGVLNFGMMKAMTQKELPLTYTLPSPAHTTRGNLELFLFKDGKRVGDNRYPMTVAVSASPSAGSKRIALYDSAERVFRGLIKFSSTRVLAELGVKTETITDFKHLDKYGFLIIGSSSFDKTLIDSADILYKWVRNGGKILCLEQKLCGRIPFYPDLSVLAGARSSYVPLSVPTHPLFKGLIQEDFDSWAGDLGAMYEFTLGPLNTALVAIAATSSHRDNAEDAKPVICDVKLGKGQMIFSQLTAGKRIATDSVARAYMSNLLAYFMNHGVSRFAVCLPETDFTKTMFLEDDKAFFVDLTKFANRGFTDDKAGDRKGGWADFGAGFPGIPTGITRLQGGIPFKIIDPRTNNGNSCLVLKGVKRPWFPAKVIGIPIGVKLNSIYFLHTSMYARPGAALRYVFHYANKETREFIAVTENELPDWWNPKSRKNAVVVYRSGKKGLFLSEFVNPLPRVVITGMDIISAEGSIPIVIAVTGRKRFTSVIAGQGEQ